MTIGLWRAVALALLLLFVQQLSLAHALEHVAADTLQFTPEGDAADCPECLALGGLQPGGAPPGKAWLAMELADEGLVFVLVAGPSGRAEVAHAIRGPPENRD